MSASYPCNSTFAPEKAEYFMPGWSKFVCSAMIVILPTSLIAQDSSRAMLHSNGGVWLNGNPAPNSSAIFLHRIEELVHVAQLQTYGVRMTLVRSGGVW